MIAPAWRRWCSRSKHASSVAGVEPRRDVGIRAEQLAEPPGCAPIARAPPRDRRERVALHHLVRLLARQPGLAPARAAPPRRRTARRCDRGSRACARAWTTRPVDQAGRARDHEVGEDRSRRASIDALDATSARCRARATARRPRAPALRVASAAGARARTGSRDRIGFFLCGIAERALLALAEAPPRPRRPRCAASGAR